MYMSRAVNEAAAKQGAIPQPENLRDAVREAAILAGTRNPDTVEAEQITHSLEAVTRAQAYLDEHIQAGDTSSEAYHQLKRTVDRLLGNHLDITSMRNAGERKVKI